MYLLFLYSHVFCLWPYGYLTVHRNNVFVCCSCIYMFFGLWPFGYVAVYGDQCTQCKEARQSHLPILAHGHTSLHHPSHERRWKTKKWQTKNFKKTAISQPNNQHQLVPLWPYACNHYSRLIKVVVIFVISLVYLLSFLPGVIISISINFSTWRDHFPPGKVDKAMTGQKIKLEKFDGRRHLWMLPSLFFTRIFFVVWVFWGRWGRLDTNLCRRQLPSPRPAHSTVRLYTFAAEEMKWYDTGVFLSKVLLIKGIHMIPT